jgi:hypothetical protein
MALLAPALILVHTLYPMRIDVFLTLLPQAISMYFLFCLVANWLSIVSPMRVAAGTLKPARTNALTILLNIIVMVLLPVVLGLTLVPMAVEFALASLGWLRGMPVCLALSLMECVAVVYIYRLALNRQGNWLQAREKQILKIVMTRAE